MHCDGKFSDMKISDYTDKSIVVQGETRKYKEDLKKLGGKYNPQLNGGPGWVFPKTCEKELKAFILNGVHIVLEKNEEKFNKTVTENSNRSTKTNVFVHSAPTLGEFAILLNTINNMAAKINKIEIGLNFLLNDDQKKTLNTIVNAGISEKKPVRNIKKEDNEFVKKHDKEFNDKEFDNINVDSDLDIEEESIPVKRLLRK